MTGRERIEQAAKENGWSLIEARHVWWKPDRFAVQYQHPEGAQLYLEYYPSGRVRTAIKSYDNRFVGGSICPGRAWSKREIEVIAYLQQHKEQA